MGVNMFKGELGAKNIAYAKDVLSDYSFGAILVGNLDYSSIETFTTLEKVEIVDFSRGYNQARRVEILIDWLHRKSDSGSVFFFFNFCDRRADFSYDRFANVFYYGEEKFEAELVVRVVPSRSAVGVIAQSLHDAEVNTRFLGVEICADMWDDSWLYGTMAFCRLASIMASAKSVILGICDGEGWCVIPTMAPKP